MSIHFLSMHFTPCFYSVDPTGLADAKWQKVHIHSWIDLFIFIEAYTRVLTDLLLALPLLLHTDLWTIQNWQNREFFWNGEGVTHARYSQLLTRTLRNQPTNQKKKKKTKWGISLCIHDNCIDPKRFLFLIRHIFVKIHTGFMFYADLY